MKRTPFNVDHIPLMQDVWRFIKRYFDIPYDDVVKISFSYKAKKSEDYHYLNIERVNAQEGIAIPLEESSAFVIALLKEFNLDWRPVSSLSFDIDADSIPVFDMGIYPYINHKRRG